MRDPGAPVGAVDKRLWALLPIGRRTTPHSDRGRHRGIETESPTWTEDFYADRMFMCGGGRVVDRPAFGTA